MLSYEAICWLAEIGFSERTHDERLVLIEAAKIAYPNLNPNDPDMDLIEDMNNALTEGS